MTGSPGPGKVTGSGSWLGWCSRGWPVEARSMAAGCGAGAVDEVWSGVGHRLGAAGAPSVPTGPVADGSGSVEADGGAGGVATGRGSVVGDGCGPGSGPGRGPAGPGGGPVPGPGSAGGPDGAGSAGAGPPGAAVSPGPRPSANEPDA